MSEFGQQLREMGFRTYADYLKSPIWKRFKAKYKASNRTHACAVCGEKKVHLHHHTYDRLGCEEIDDVTPLCETHHNEVHFILSERKWSVERTHECIRMLKGECSFRAGVAFPAHVQKLQARKRTRKQIAHEKRVAESRAAKKKKKDPRGLTPPERDRLKKEEAAEAHRLMIESIRNLPPPIPSGTAKPSATSIHERQTARAEMRERLKQIRESRLQTPITTPDEKPTFPNELAPPNYDWNPHEMAARLTIEQLETLRKISEFSQKNGALWSDRHIATGQLSAIRRAVRLKSKHRK